MKALLIAAIADFVSTGLTARGFAVHAEAKVAPACLGDPA